MAPNPEIRASDADRDRVATSLREHCALGRITTEELQERIEAVYEARTLGQLEEVTSDLPEEDLDQYELPVPAAQRTTPAKRDAAEVYRRGGKAVWATWALVSGINFTVWLIIALTGNVVFPWWLWVAGPWGIVLLVGTLLGPKRRD